MTPLKKDLAHISPGKMSHKVPITYPSCLPAVPAPLKCCTPCPTSCKPPADCTIRVPLSMEIPQALGTRSEWSLSFQGIFLFQEST